jgi:hypothetical protein
MATPSYRERMKAARAAASAQRKAEKAEWLRQVELRVEVKRLAPRGRHLLNPSRRGKSSELHASRDRGSGPDLPVAHCEGEGAHR